MKKRLAGRILISVIGAAFILWGLTDLALGVLGESATAVVTTIRRQGGERDDARPGRYTYQIGYRFILDGSRQIDGSFTKMGDALYMKADSAGTVAIRYFPAAPFINAPEENARPSLRQPVLIGVGCFLLVVVNRLKRRRIFRAKGADG